MDERTKSRIYALKVGDFHNPNFSIDAMPCPEGFDIGEINPYLKEYLRVCGVEQFLYWHHRANEFPPVTDPNTALGYGHSDYEKTLSTYIGHGMDLWFGLVNLIETSESPSVVFREGATCLGKSIWSSGVLVNTLNESSSYTGKLLNRASAVKGRVDTHKNDNFLERARELYTAGQIEPYFQIASGTLARALTHREKIRDLGLDLIQRLLDDPNFDVCDESMLSPEEKQAYERAIEKALDCQYDFYSDLEARKKVSYFPDRENFLVEQRKIDDALSGLEPIIQKFHKHVRDYSGVEK